MRFWFWPRDSFQSLSLWAAFGAVSMSFARAAEAEPRMRAAARAIFVLVNIVVSPVVCCSHPAGVRAYLVDMNARVNQPDVLSKSIAEGRRDAARPMGNRLLQLTQPAEDQCFGHGTGVFGRHGRVEGPYFMKIIVLEDDACNRCPST